MRHQPVQWIPAERELKSRLMKLLAYKPFSEKNRIVLMTYGYPTFLFKFVCDPVPVNMPFQS